MLYMKGPASILDFGHVYNTYAKVQAWTLTCAARGDWLCYEVMDLLWMIGAEPHKNANTTANTNAHENANTTANTHAHENANTTAITNTGEAYGCTLF